MTRWLKSLVLTAAVLMLWPLPLEAGPGKDKRTTTKQRAGKAGKQRVSRKARNRQLVPRTRARLARPQKGLKRTNKLRTGKKARAVAKKRPVRRARRHVKLSLKRFNKQDRRALLQLLASKQVKASSQARNLVAEFIRLKAAGRAMPFSVKDLKTMTRGGAWSSRRMGNLARVLRAARYIAKRDKVSVKEAFKKALKAAGISKKANSGVCPA